jgi:hypothetical protein
MGKSAHYRPGTGGDCLFEQFKENLSLARDFTEAVHEGLKSAQAAWRRATPMKRTLWLGVPTVIVINVVAEHFSVPWYYEAATPVLVVLGSWTLEVMRRRPQ